MQSADRKRGSDLPPSELDLVISCTHSKRCLLNAGVRTLAQLHALSREDLLRIRGIGPVIADGILKAQATDATRSDDRLSR